MNDEERVKELMEQIRLTDEEIQAIILNHKRYPQSNYASGRNELANSIAKAQRDKIFSNPDYPLALRIDTTRQGADEDGAMQTYKAVEYIHLAEAIKEMKK